MLRFFRTSGWAHEPLSRREWLRIGGVASLGLALDKSRSSLSAAETFDSNPGFGRAKSVILIYASGGQSQLDMWDPKPLAPAAVRGEFSSIETSVAGTRLCEYLPRVARLAHLYSIIRSVSHDDVDHGSATYLALTGKPHPRKSSNPPPRPTDEPTYGAILKRIRPHGGFPYPAIHLNGPALVPDVVAPGQDGGFLGRDFEPLVLGDVHEAPVAVPCLDRLPQLDASRLSSRQGLLGMLEASSRLFEQNRKRIDLDEIYRQAFNFLSSPRYRRAFDLAEEETTLRDRYGRHRPGQACLLARRLVEAGVPLITVIWNRSNRGQDIAPNSTDLYGWDTHNDIFDGLKTHLLPRFDATFSTLLEDLQARGLLDRTLVICMGEFGRAPQIAVESNFAGRLPGRKHWASVYSVVMAGAGVRGGLVYGASDKIGAQPVSHALRPEDISATLYSALGIDPESFYPDLLGRPVLVSPGKPIAGLFSG